MELIRGVLRACLISSLALATLAVARADDFVDPFLGADADIELTAPAEPSPARVDEETEAEPELASAELLPPALLAGPDYRVEARAQLHGFQAHFVLHTDYGELSAESVEILALRVQEMEALKVLHAESVTAALAKSGAEAVMAPLRAVANVVQRPGEAITGLPRGVWRYFSERVTRIGQRAKRLGARADQRISHDGSPFDAADAPMAASRRPREKGEDSWFGDVGDEVVRLAKSEAGYGRARRELAARLGIDPFTGNPLIRERLDTLAWAATAGKLGVGQAMGLLDPVTSEVLGTSSEVNRLVLELPPEDLRRRNDERLMGLGANEELRYTFLQFGRYSPTLQTALVEWLERLQPKSGVDALLEIALMAQNEVEARFMVNALAMIHAHLGDRAIHGHLVGVGALLAYDSPDGERVFPLPVDLLSWTPDTARWFAQPGLWDHTNRSLLVGGAASMKAQRALSRDGWNLFLHLHYEGAPEYAPGWGTLPPG
ncbi:MAG: hypothetical protein ACK5PG_17795 [Lysobacterales bacterium]